MVNHTNMSFPSSSGTVALQIQLYNSNFFPTALPANKSVHTTFPDFPKKLFPKQHLFSCLGHAVIAGQYISWNYYL